MMSPGLSKACSGATIPHYRQQHYRKLSGLESAFREVYPKADVQHCIVHKIRATFPKIRVEDKTDFLADLKTVYSALDHDLALAAFDTVKAKWGKL